MSRIWTHEIEQGFRTQARRHVIAATNSHITIASVDKELRYSLWDQFEPMNEAIDDMVQDGVDDV